MVLLFIIFVYSWIELTGDSVDNGNPFSWLSSLSSLTKHCDNGVSFTGSCLADWKQISLQQAHRAAPLHLLQGDLDKMAEGDEKKFWSTERVWRYQPPEHGLGSSR